MLGAESVAGVDVAYAEEKLDMMADALRETKAALCPKLEVNDADYARIQKVDVTESVGEKDSPALLFTAEVDADVAFSFIAGMPVWVTLAVIWTAIMSPSMLDIVLVGYGTRQVVPKLMCRAGDGALEMILENPPLMID